jgi:hypothetical protein
MMPQRPARRWRRVRGVFQAVGIALLLAFALWRLSYALVGRPDEPVAVSWCHAAYARATSHQDSAIVDAQRPVVSREQATTGVSCGTLRSTGAL